MLTFHAVRIQKLAVKGREGGMEGGVFAPGTVALRDGMGGGGWGELSCNTVPPCCRNKASKILMTGFILVY